MRSNDTSPVAAALHEEAQRRIGPAGRLKIALELSDLTQLARVLYGPKA
jgi:hypothetical protein